MVIYFKVNGKECCENKKNKLDLHCVICEYFNGHDKHCEHGLKTYTKTMYCEAYECCYFMKKIPNVNFLTFRRK